MRTLLINYLINLKSIHTGSTVEFLILNLSVSDEWIWCPDQKKIRVFVAFWCHYKLSFQCIVVILLDTYIVPQLKNHLKLVVHLTWLLVVLDSIIAIRYPDYILFSFFSVLESVVISFKWKMILNVVFWALGELIAPGLSVV